MPRRVPVLLLAALLAGACSGPPPASIPDRRAVPVPAAGVTVRAVEYRFHLPAHWPAGWVTVTLLDDGGQPHQLQLARLRPGASADAVRDDLAGSPAAAFAQLVLEGGPDTVEPGLGQRVTIWLEPGAYLALDLAAGPGGIQNATRGMLQPFTVDQPAAGTRPEAQGSLVERSFGYDLPAIPAGPVVLQVEDRSDEDDHEAALVRIDAGRGLADVLAFVRAPDGPPPFRFAGGMAAMEPGGTGFLDLDLDPGSYAVLCFVTDPGTGRFHFDEGMIQAFTVGAR